MFYHGTSGPSCDNEDVLRLVGLTKVFASFWRRQDGYVVAVNDVSLGIRRGEVRQYRSINFAFKFCLSVNYDLLFGCAALADNLTCFDSTIGPQRSKMSSQGISTHLLFVGNNHCTDLIDNLTCFVSTFGPQKSKIWEIPFSMERIGEDYSNQILLKGKKVPFLENQIQRAK